MNTGNVAARVKCPECPTILDFELTGEAALLLGPETLTIRYVPIVLDHKCESKAELRKELEKNATEV